MLRRLLISKKLVKIIEVHSPISALVVENTKIKSQKEMRGFDGFGLALYVTQFKWESQIMKF